MSSTDGSCSACSANSSVPAARKKENFDWKGKRFLFSESGPSFVYNFLQLKFFTIICVCPSRVQKTDRGRPTSESAL